MHVAHVFCSKSPSAPPPPPPSNTAHQQPFRVFQNISVSIISSTKYILTLLWSWCQSGGFSVFLSYSGCSSECRLGHECLAAPRRLMVVQNFVFPSCSTAATGVATSREYSTATRLRKICWMPTAAAPTEVGGIHGSTCLFCRSPPEGFSRQTIINLWTDAYWPSEVHSRITELFSLLLPASGDVFCVRSFIKMQCRVHAQFMATYMYSSVCARKKRTVTVNISYLRTLSRVPCMTA